MDNSPEMATGSPAELEIGAGKGKFVLDRAAALPGVRFVAVEIRRKHAGLMAARAEKRSLANLAVVRGDIRDVLRGPGGEAGRFRRVFIHFPDPWWKKRHHKRLLLQGDIVEGALSVLTPGGELYIQTDVFPRARELLALLSGHPLLENLDAAGGFLPASPFDQKSAREALCERLGLAIFRMWFRKRGEV